MSSEAWLAEKMLEMGTTALVPSVESSPASIWVEDDDKVPVPGYYEKRHVPMRHGITADGRSAALAFWRKQIRYRIQHGGKETHAENLEYVIGVFKTILGWIDDSLLTWDVAFAAFERYDENVWWKVLRLPPDATISEIDRAYRHLARKAHPDMGGSQESFLRVRDAYDQALNVER